MAQMRFNEVLKEARERKGYDLDTVARRLRIRPDILRAIEAGDFAAMPPRGYTRNMVNAYARLLGLNPTEIVNMYLDEAYAVQVQRARDRAPGSGFDMSEADRRGHRQTRGSRLEEDNAPISGWTRGSNNRSRDLYDDRTRFSRDDYGTTRERSRRTDRSDRDFLSHHSGYPSTGFNFADESEGRFSRRRGGVTVGTTPMRYSASRLPGFMQSRLALIIGAVVIVAIIVLILVLVLGNGSKQEEENVTQLPVSGITDTTGTSDDIVAAAAARVAIAPTSARVAYSSNSNDGCYVQIYVDGEMESEQMLDKKEKTVDVTGKWTIATFTPDYLDLTVDGEKKTLKSNEEYDGMYTYTVDFDEILAKWEEDHPDSKASRRAAAAASATNKTESEKDSEKESDTDADTDTASASSSTDSTDWTNSSSYYDNSAANAYGYYDDGTGSYDYYDQSYYADGTGYYYDQSYYDNGTGYYYDQTYYDNGTGYYYDQSYYGDGTGYVQDGTY